MTEFNVLVALDNDHRREQLVGNILSKHKVRFLLLTEHPAPEHLAKCEYVITWNSDTSLWSRLPKLKLVQNFGAGVDHLDLSNNRLQQVPVCRFSDPGLSQQMANYVLAQILTDKLKFSDFQIAQNKSKWQCLVPRAGNKVAILGIGEIGIVVAKLLNQTGFEVMAWRRSPKEIHGVSVFYGQEGLESMLSEADYLINILPLTLETTGLINQDFLNLLNPECCLINVGRGKTVDEKALVNSLNAGLLRKAILDVFEQEPLPENSVLWSHQGIQITPHIASLSDPEAVVDLFLDNIHRLNSGRKLRHLVSIDKGY